MKREKSKNLISNESFIFEDKEKYLFTLLTTGQINLPQEESDQQINMEEFVLNLLEIELKTRFKAENILTKYDSYQTPQAIVGHKVFGGFSANNENQIKKIGYQYYFFMNNNRLTALFFCYPQEDTVYQNVLIEKIMSSLNIK